MFATAGGHTNQYLGMRAALFLAYVSNRTLVLPPLHDGAQIQTQTQTQTQAQAPPHCWGELNDTEQANFANHTEQVCGCVCVYKQLSIGRLRPTEE